MELNRVDYNLLLKIAKTDPKNKIFDSFKSYVARDELDVDNGNVFYNFIRRLLKNKIDIPPAILNIISSFNPDTLYYEFRDIFKEIDTNELHSIIIDIISSDSDIALEYAQDILDKNRDVDTDKIPKKVIEGIAKESSNAFRFSKMLVNNGRPVDTLPEDLIDSMSEDTAYAEEFIMFLANIKKVKLTPAKIIKILTYDKVASYEIAEKLKSMGVEIPQEILKAANVYKITNLKEFNQFFDKYK